MYSIGGSPTLTNITFSGNSASSGGGMYSQSSRPQLTNVTFSNNFAGGRGGGIYKVDSSTTLVNCVLWGNEANGSTDQSAQIFLPGTSAITVTYSLVQGGVYTGTGNISVDPQFVRNPDPGDGDWTTLADNDYGDLSLLPSSPVIDKGYNAALPADTTDVDGDGDTSEPLPFDRAGKPRIIGSSVDMGAHEWCLQDFVPFVLRNW
jgi:predicted outer membrane repeat protein